MIDPIADIAGKEILQEIEKLWTRTEALNMVGGDLLNLTVSMDNTILNKITVHSVKEGLDWLSNQYQDIEAKLYRETT